MDGGMTEGWSDVRWDGKLDGQVFGWMDAGIFLNDRLMFNWRFDERWMDKRMDVR